jgi:4-hydroxybenzoate polyprenyltransferase
VPGVTTKTTVAGGTGKLSAIAGLIRLPRQQGTLLLLWPTLWSLFLASKGAPEARLVVIFSLGAFLMRSAGCAINDIADRDFDRGVERTRSRPIPAGSLSVKEAFTVFIMLSALAFSLVLFLNALTIILSFVGLLLAAAYPLVKRVSRLPQAFLGMAFGWGAVMAWSATTGEIGETALIIFAANIFWSMAYDTIYALMDREDDIRVGVGSTAILFGGRVRLALVLLYAGFVAALLGTGYAAGLGAAYYCGVGVSAALFFRLAASLGKEPAREAAYRAFTANSAIGALILASIVVDLRFF